MSEEERNLPAPLSAELPEEHKADPTLPEEFKDAEKLKAAVGKALGKPVKAMVYGPFGEMLHQGANDYLKEHEPKLWARLQKDKFGS